MHTHVVAVKRGWKQVFFGFNISKMAENRAGEKAWIYTLNMVIHRRQMQAFWNFTEKNWEIAWHSQKIARHYESVAWQIARHFVFVSTPNICGLMKENMFNNNISYTKSSC